MKFYYCNKTKKKIPEFEFNKLSSEDQKEYRPWVDGNRNSGSKNGGTKSKKQDYQWYEITDGISKSVGSIPFNRFPGMQEVIPIMKHGGQADVLLRNACINSMPGVLTINYVPSYGKSDSATSAINMAMRSMYTFVRHQNSGRTNYEAPDLMLYVMSMDQVYTKFQELCRIYELAMTYTYVNKNIPDLIISSLGVDPSNIRANLAQFRYGINLRAAKIGSMCVPDKFNIFMRHSYIARNVFVDSDSTRGQFYAFRSSGHYVFNAKSSSGGSLVYINEFDLSANKTYQDLLNELDSLLNPILEDEDMNIMSGDILKAYGRENLYTLSEVDEKSTVNFVFNTDVLSQIENSSTVNTYISLPDLPSTVPEDEAVTTLRIVQQNGFLFTQDYLWNEAVSTNTVVFKSDKQYFNSHKDDPDYKDVIEWSRDTCGTSYGTEYVWSYSIWAIGYNSTEGTDGQPSYIIPYLKTFYSESPSVQTSSVLGYLECFDWHPIVYHISYDGDAEPAVFYYRGPVGDFKVYTIISEDTVARLHDAAVMGSLDSLTMKATK